MLEVRLLGGFSIRSGKKSVALTSRPAQSLFAYLVLNAGIPHRREKLAGQLWPDSREEAARDYLRHALWRIRKVLTDISAAGLLKADDLSVTFVPTEDCLVDSATVSRAAESKSADALMQALSAYQGELLPGFYDEWVVLEREHLKAIYEQEMDRLLGMLEQAGKWPQVLEWAEKWIAFGQKPEPAYRGLMLAHAANGDMSKVAASYERCAKTLSEFGVKPSEQTKSLYADLKTGKQVPVSAIPVQRSNPKATGISNVPVPLTSFIGREQEVRQVVSLLGHGRLITLMGPGGVGKTRLAMETARSLIGRYPEGVWWVDLVGIHDPALVPQALAQVAGVHEVAGEPLLVSLAQQIGSRRALIVLDNCEHLISACAQLAEELLAGCKRLRILTTSREALDILGETTWMVPSLSLPDAEGAEFDRDARQGGERPALRGARGVSPGRFQAA